MPSYLTKLWRCALRCVISNLPAISSHLIQLRNLAFYSWSGSHILLGPLSPYYNQAHHFRWQSLCGVASLFKLRFYWSRGHIWTLLSLSICHKRHVRGLASPSLYVSILVLLPERLSPGLYHLLCSRCGVSLTIVLWCPHKHYHQWHPLESISPTPRSCSPPYPLIF